ncbi:MAG: hypothetical protein H6531_11265 [Actinobacteria bacterium]|nr:hypothetical protein [Thermoleophilia bacterium]MCB9012393.1 hypothetical protein [Actinomycetota bacterium]
MQQGIMIMRWNGAKIGHEIEAMKLADEANLHFGALEDQGATSSHEWIANFTGTDGGMVALRGDPQSLMAVSASPEFQEIHLRGILHLDGWRLDIGLAGSTVDDVYPGWRGLVGA